MSEKVFCGSGKVVTTEFGELVKISFSKKDLETMLENLNDKGWINTVLKAKRNVEDGKATHYLEVDFWKAK